MAQVQNTAASHDAAEQFKVGLLSAFVAYFIWGMSPAYFKLTAEAPALAVVSYRVLASVFFVGGLLWWRRELGLVTAIFRSKRIFLTVLAASLLLSLNWLAFIWAIEVGRVLDASFGYFINPLVSVAFAVIFLSERLTKGQLAAVGLTLVGVGYQIFVMGTLPWVSLFLAFSFAGYAVVRKKLPIGALSGQLAEVLCMAPFALVTLLILGFTGYNVVPVEQPELFAALVGTGIITAAPLILFAYGAQRIPMIYVGFMQYVAPSLQFILAVWAYGEPLSTDRLISFVIIWISLAIFTVDGVIRARRRKAERAMAARQG
ncbi:EamA family transporter RarD [Rhodobacteraceae bacterium RKSG542]|uniref:EamA family transporter RarD n=1 Tax=Pseudovibrio flavus TaxID=2529854 RepID=UPI0012BD5496|nr:EamA family transporter RarD [Pseudovibrio flavus]MTI16727.1 EamA family transporter RarD [Pseudovibrio flavus]